MKKGMGKRTVFEKNPKKTGVMLGVFLIVSFAFFLCATEVFLSYRNSKMLEEVKFDDDARTRAIRLNEYHPGLSKKVTPGKKYMKRKRIKTLERKEYSLRTDNDGFIMPSGAHESPDIKIFFLGASTVECLFVEEEKRYPFLVGKLIEERTGLKVNAYNGARGGAIRCTLSMF